MSPYIAKNLRPKPGLETLLISQIQKAPLDKRAGLLNYAITKLIMSVYGDQISYATINEVMGVLESCKHEFYWRVARPYEDAKCKINGDVF